MKYFIHDSDTGARQETSHAAMLQHLGSKLLHQLEESGSLSCGTSVYEAVPNKRPAAPLPADIYNDPTASDWLKEAVRASLRRDVVDALNDAMILVSVLDRRYVALTSQDR